MGDIIGLIVVTVFLIASCAAALSGNKANATDDESLSPKLKVEVVASHLQIPWSIAFAADGRIFFSERTGNIRVIENGTLLNDPAATVRVATGGEDGLLGIALDPEFENNHYLYAYYTHSDFFGILHNKVSRFTESNNKLSDEHVLLDNIPASEIHDGGRIMFGPDGKLYISTGDAANAEAAQDIRSLSGKILRINKDGSVPGDNPFQGSPVYSFGHRNPQGLAWDAITGELVETEHGPTGERGNYAHDEINVIEAGKNYGWPKVIGKANSSSYEDPVFQTGDTTWAPSGATFYESDKIPEWKGKLLVATLRGSELEIVHFDANITKVISIDSAFQGTYGRLRDIEQGPDGYLYLLTSNQDGRGGPPAADDDKILRIVGETSGVVPEFSSPFVVLSLLLGILLSWLLLPTTSKLFKKQRNPGVKYHMI